MIEHARRPSAIGYATYGEMIGTSPSQIACIGERYDTEVGFMYLNARHMDPIKARFISPDTLGPTEDGVGTDPTGHDDSLPCWRRASNERTAQLSLDDIHVFNDLANCAERKLACLWFSSQSGRFT
jgi:RHS repeat-associated protein